MNATIAATLTISAAAVFGAFYILSTALHAVAPVTKALGVH